MSHNKLFILKLVMFLSCFISAEANASDSSTISLGGNKSPQAGVNLQVVMYGISSPASPIATPICPTGQSLIDQQAAPGGIFVGSGMNGVLYYRCATISTTGNPLADIGSATNIWKSVTLPGNIPGVASTVVSNYAQLASNYQNVTLNTSLFLDSNSSNYRAAYDGGSLTGGSFSFKYYSGAGTLTSVNATYSGGAIQLATTAPLSPGTWVSLSPPSYTYQYITQTGNNPPVTHNGNLTCTFASAVYKYVPPGASVCYWYPQSSMPYTTNGTSACTVIFWQCYDGNNNTVN